MARRRQSIGGHAGALPGADLRRRLSWPHARDDRRRRPGEISGRLRAEGRRIRSDSAVTDLAAVEAAIGPETAAILIEPIQGEGGVRVIPPSFLRGLREICDRRELLLIFDEVQTGVGRTGRFYRLRALRHSSGYPDLRQRNRRGVSDVRVPRDRGRGAGAHGRGARHHVRRKSAGDGDRQCDARCDSRARLHRACREARPRTCGSGSQNSRIATVR